MSKYDLFNNPKGHEVIAFVSLVAAQAVNDHERGSSVRRTGNELCDMFATECRKGHEKMASGIYNKVRWSLDTKWK